MNKFNRNLTNNYVTENKKFGRRVSTLKDGVSAYAHETFQSRNNAINEYRTIVYEVAVSRRKLSLSI